MFGILKPTARSSGAIIRFAGGCFTHSPNPVAMSLPPFNRTIGTAYTQSPNSSWTWGQPITSTTDGRAWMDGEKEGWKTVRTAEMEPSKMYALMISGIVPRPIALVSSTSPEGIDNLAPFSWFGMLSHSPPVVAISCLHATPTPARLKDTTTNITAATRADHGFVINIISKPFIEQANATSIDAPLNVDEWTLSGLTKVPSVSVKPPRIRESAFSMECQLYHTFPITDDDGACGTTLILARVTHIHVRNDMLTPRGTVDVTKFRPVGRMGDNLYARVGDAFKLARPSWSADADAVRLALEQSDERASEDAKL